MIDRAAVIHADGEATARAIERDYRATGPFQWAREVLVNVKEAGGTRIVFAPHPDFARKGIWRMTISDNGSGMDEEELLAFFRSYGGSGRAVGGEHENMGIGAKTNLLPWNPLGVTVASVKDDVPAMIHIRHDAESGVYYLRQFDIGDGEVSLTVDPDFYDEEFGVNWSSSIPEWIEGHGTSITLLGSIEDPHSFLGSPRHRDDEWRSQSALSMYLAQKFWDLEDLDVTVIETHTAQLEKFDPNDLWTRHIRPLRAHVEYADGFAATKGGRRELPSTVEQAGTVSLSDGTDVWWTVHKEGTRTKSTREMPKGVGFVGVLHRGEMFNITDHAMTLRQFGLTTPESRSRVTLIVVPKDAGDHVKRGVYMTTDRSRLLVRGGAKAGQELPLSDWAYEFSSNLPVEISELRPTRTATSHAARIALLIEKFGYRWHKGSGPVGSLFGSQDARTGEKGARAALASRVRERKPSKPDGTTRSPSTGLKANASTKGRVKGTPSGGASPDWEWYNADETDDLFAGTWDPAAQRLSLKREFGPVQELVENQEVRYPNQDFGDVRQAVEDILGEVVLARVMHASLLKGFPKEALNERVISPESITFALCGILAEEAVINTRVGGMLGRAVAA